MGFKIKAPKISAPKISLPAPVKQVGSALSAINPYTQAAQIWTGKNPLGGVFGGGGGGPGDPGDPYAGMPGLPGFESLRDPATGNLMSKYMSDPTQSGAFVSLRDQAMSTGPSAWANMQTQRQKLEEQNLRNAASKQGLTALSQGQSQLARTGGLSSGAAALMASRGSRDMMLRNQDIGRQGMLDRLGIGQQDETTRQGLLKDVANIQLGANEANRSTLLGDVGTGNQNRMNLYGLQSGIWGAGKTADAQLALANQPKQPGGLLGMFGGFANGGGIGSLF